MGEVFFLSLFWVLCNLHKNIFFINVVSGLCFGWKKSYTWNELLVSLIIDCDFFNFIPGFPLKEDGGDCIEIVLNLGTGFGTDLSNWSLVSWQRRIFWRWKKELKNIKI